MKTVKKARRGRPPAGGPKSISKSMYLPEDWWAELEEIAEKNGTSLAEEIRYAVGKGLGKKVERTK